MASQGLNHDTKSHQLNHDTDFHTNFCTDSTRISARICSSLICFFFSYLQLQKMHARTDFFPKPSRKRHRGHKNSCKNSCTVKTTDSIISRRLLKEANSSGQLGSDLFNPALQCFACAAGNEFREPCEPTGNHNENNFPEQLLYEAQY
jgi:hypothetical protein